MNPESFKKVKKENEPYYDEDNYLCLVQISDSEINKKKWFVLKANKHKQKLKTTKMLRFVLNIGCADWTVDVPDWEHKVRGPRM